MPEILNNRKIYSLMEMTLSIQKGLEERYARTYWIKAEMNKLNATPGSGHCFPELVEKKEGKIIAQMRGHLWRGDYERVNRAFLEVLKEPLKDGIKIFFEAQVIFHPVYGLSLWIKDVDPRFTLGDLEQEKQATITRLKAEGLFEQNQQLRLPLLPQRIAIISVQNSNGYGDFIEILESNPWGYRFFHMLFPASLQGDRVVADMTRQLKRIQKVAHHFDAVAIIRGGGGDVGLSCYNDYQLARAICEFPLPVLTGIGHSTNLTVCEMVANARAITPTKMGELLLGKFHEFSVPVLEAGKKVASFSKYVLSTEQTAMHNAYLLFRSISLRGVLKYSHEIVGYSQRLEQQGRFKLRKAENEIQRRCQEVRKACSLLLSGHDQHLKLQTVASFREGKSRNKHENEHLVQLTKELGRNIKQLFLNASREITSLDNQRQAMDPASVLRRGYSLTTANGKVLMDVNGLQPGSKITTRLYKGQIESTIDHLEKNNKDE